MAIVEKVKKKATEVKSKASNLINEKKAKASNLISGRKVKQLEGIETILDLEYELKKLNPKVNISLTGKGRSQNLQIDCLPEDLKMPEGFYYDFKNGITNKGNSSVSMTMSAGVCLEPLEWDLNTTDHRRIYYEMKRLNPNVEIKMQAQSYFGYVTYSRENFRRHQLVSDTDCQLVLPEGVNIEDLNMPEGFYYNTKNGLTNRHNAQGMYTGMDVVNDTPENIANNVVEYERNNSL